MDHAAAERMKMRLSQLSTDQLKEILVLSVQPNEQVSEDTIEATLEILMEREENPEPSAEPEMVYHRLKQNWNRSDGMAQEQTCAAEPISESTGPERKDCRRWHWRLSIVVAATVVLLLALLTVAYAIGMDSYGALGCWTDDVFFFYTG